MGVPTETRKWVGGAALALALFGSLLVAEAQQAGKVARVGFLSFGAGPGSPLIEAFREGLRERGLVEGQTVLIEWRFAELRRPDLVAQLAIELVRLKPDVIVATAGPAVHAVKRETETIPIVFAFSGDPVDTGLVSSLARPGANITGLSFMSPDLSAKRLGLLKEAFPRISRVAVFSNAADPVYAFDMRGTQAAARTLGLTLQSLDVRGRSDLETAFAAMSRENADALITFGHALMIGVRKDIVELAAKHRVPAMYGFRLFVDAGGLMSFGPNLPDLFRRTAYYVDRILKGAKPATLPVEQPTKFELVINLKTAKALGLTIPQSLLQRADQVIK